MRRCRYGRIRASVLLELLRSAGMRVRIGMEHDTEST